MTIKALTLYSVDVYQTRLAETPDGIAPTKTKFLQGLRITAEDPEGAREIARVLALRHDATLDNRGTSVLGFQVRKLKQPYIYVDAA